MKRTEVLTKSGTLALVIAGLAACAVTAGAQVMYSDNFTGSGNALNGSAVPGGTGSGALWQAGDTWLDNGTAGTTIASSANGQAAWLPFTPLDGFIYTASATVLNDQPNWIGFGFLPALPPGGDWTATDYSVRHSNAGGYAWLLTRNSTGQSQQAFNGPNTSNGTGISGDIVDPAQPVTISIVLNTTASTWTAQYYLDGVQQGGTFDLASTANTAIGGIGFSHDRNSTANAGGTISAFTLTAVPEPATFALLGLGSLLGIFGLRGRK